MIEKKLFKYLKDYYNFNKFYEMYLQNNPSAYFGYDILFRDWTEEYYTESEYIRWHKWLLEIIGAEGYILLSQQVNS